MSMEMTVTLPDGRDLEVGVEYTPGRRGSYWDPPEPPECELLWATETEGGRELSEAEVDALMQDDAVYNVVIDAAEKRLDDLLYDAMEGRSEDMDGDHGTALESAGLGEEF